MKLTLFKKAEVATDTLSFYWKTSKAVNYLPGQFFYWTLPSLIEPDPRGNTRMFTLASSPTEGDILMSATRIRDKSHYKQSLAQLKVGDVIDGDGPEGTFILDQNESGPHILIAGGIGITPFRSMIKYNLDKKSPSKIHLIYLNKTPDLAAFKEEFESWAKKSNHFRLDFIWTKKEGHLGEKQLDSLTYN